MATNPALAIRTGTYRKQEQAEPASAGDRTSYSDELNEEAAAANNARQSGPLGASPTRPDDNVDLLIQNLLGLNHPDHPAPGQAVKEVGAANGAGDKQASTVASVAAASQDQPPSRHAEPGLQYSRGVDRVDMSAEATQRMQRPQSVAPSEPAVRPQPVPTQAA